MFIKKAPNSHGWVSPKVVEELWMDQFNYFYRYTQTLPGADTTSFD